MIGEMDTYEEKKDMHEEKRKENKIPTYITHEHILNTIAPEIYSFFLLFFYFLLTPLVFSSIWTCILLYDGFIKVFVVQSLYKGKSCFKISKVASKVASADSYSRLSNKII